MALSDCVRKYSLGRYHVACFRRQLPHYIEKHVKKEDLSVPQPQNMPIPRKFIPSFLFLSSSPLSSHTSIQNSLEPSISPTETIIHPSTTLLPITTHRSSLNLTNFRLSKKSIANSRLAPELFLFHPSPLGQLQIQIPNNQSWFGKSPFFLYVDASRWSESTERRSASF